MAAGGGGGSQEDQKGKANLAGHLSRALAFSGEVSVGRRGLGMGASRSRELRSQLSLEEQWEPHRVPAQGRTVCTHAALSLKQLQP